MSSLSLDAGVLPLPRPSQQPRALPRPLARPGAARRDADRAEVLKALVLRARDGDAEAFGCLYDHYVELVYRYVYYRVDE